MMDDMRVVFESGNRRACADRSLVLSAANIPHQVISDLSGYAVIVPAEVSAEAIAELHLYEEENPPPRPPPKINFQYQNAVPGIIGYLVVIVLFAGLSWSSAFNEDWLAAGRVDGILIRAGEWWRSLTALTMHSGFRHLAGNIVFGAFFGFLAGRLLGSGIAWLLIVIAAACGNVVNVLLLDSAHKAIGASTAVFAALGVTSGFVWRAKLMSQERWSYRIAPIVGGLALLMFTGTGDENTDIGAHLMGFACGFLGGIVLTRYQHLLTQPDLQRYAGITAPALLVLAWIVAFGG